MLVVYIPFLQQARFGACQQWRTVGDAGPYIDGILHVAVLYNPSVTTSCATSLCTREAFVPLYVCIHTDNSTARLLILIAKVNDAKKMGSKKAL